MNEGGDSGGQQAGKGVWEPGQAQEWVHPRRPKATSLSQGQAACVTKRSLRNWGKSLVGGVPTPNQLRHGAHMTRSTRHCLGLGTPEFPGPEKTNFGYVPRLLQERLGQMDEGHFPHFPAWDTEAWPVLTGTGAHLAGCWGPGSPPPSSQDPGVAHHCARSPASLEMAMSTCPLPDPLTRPPAPAQH